MVDCKDLDARCWAGMADGKNRSEVLLEAAEEKKADCCDNFEGGSHTAASSCGLFPRMSAKSKHEDIGMDVDGTKSASSLLGDSPQSSVSDPTMAPPTVPRKPWQT